MVYIEIHHPHHGLKTDYGLKLLLTVVAQIIVSLASTTLYSLSVYNDAFK